MADNLQTGAADPSSQLFQGVNAAKVLSERANQYGPTVKKLGPGSLVQFTYIFAQPGHDRTPLVLITRLMDKYIKGHITDTVKERKMLDFNVYGTKKP